MAIASIRNPFKLRFPRRLRQREKSQGTPPNTGACDGGSLLCREGELRKVFRYFDANNDGRISAVELKDYFASAGDSVSDEAAEKIMREFGAEGSLLLEFEEFVRMIESRDGDDDNTVLRQAFEVYLVDKSSGYITAEGLRCVLRRLGDVKSREECETIISVFDLDGNGVLDFHEFQKMMS